MFEGLPAVGEPFQGRIRCCEDDYGGTHWHCAKCNGVTSMMGHLTSGFRYRDEWVEFPDGKTYFTCDPKTEQLIESMTRGEEDTRIL